MAGTGRPLATIDFVSARVREEVWVPDGLISCKSLLRRYTMTHRAESAFLRDGSKGATR